ncbi:hypothetical protein DFH08DRAFT_853302 [Mycena albidolilacea]|uniref:Uncharacterized protein n=1 Tax=Mycena albidolilacea TaxID=1033008 RepID=A0AAD7ADF6_9AGAR|nr:hypothetical protein DFH08DRAFT_853302 [Mycena albidolilacea]
MPIIPSKTPVKWLDYLESALPECPRDPIPGPIKKKKKTKLTIGRTHSPSSSSLAACGAATTLRQTNNILPRFLEGDIRTFFTENAPLIIPEDDYVQPLLNEQAVAEVYFKAVLVPVKDALQTLLAPLLKRADLAKARYFFNIRPQQPSATGDLTRCDHFLVLEHMDGIDPDDKIKAPPTDVFWQSPEEFTDMLKARQQWEQSHAAQDPVPEYPRLVLGVIEEKKPNILDITEFQSTYHAKKTTGAKNVADILPPVKKYSVDAQCPLVILTDYHVTLLLEVEEAGAQWDWSTKKIESKIGVVPVIKVCALDKPPRITLFSMAVRRLVDAKVLKVSSSKIEWDPK